MYTYCVINRLLLYSYRHRPAVKSNHEGTKQEKTLEKKLYIQYRGTDHTLGV